jgi:hypothetical protein
MHIEEEERGAKSARRFRLLLERSAREAERLLDAPRQVHPAAVPDEVKRGAKRARRFRLPLERSGLAAERFCCVHRAGFIPRDAHRGRKARSEEPRIEENEKGSRVPAGANARQDPRTVA